MIYLIGMGAVLLLGIEADRRDRDRKLRRWVSARLWLVVRDKGE